MTRIELRNATVRLVDGHSNTAEVANTPVALDDDLEIENLGTDDIIPPSARFSVVGSADLYTVQTQDAYAQLDYSDATADGGNYTITIAGQTTASILFSSNAAAILAAIELLSTVDPGDFTVTGTLAAGIVVRATTTGQYADTAVVMSAQDVDLTTSALASAQTYAGGATHHITFSPAFATAHTPANGAAITFYGRTLEVRLGDGNATYDQNREYLYDLDRQELDTVRKGDAQPLDWTLDFVWDFLTAVAGAVTPTVEDVFDRVGPAAEWISSSADGCEDYAIDIEIEQAQPCGSVDLEIVTIPDARYENLSHDIAAATVAASGRANAERAIKTRRPVIAIV